AVGGYSGSIHVTSGIFPRGCASTASGAVRRPRAKVTRSPIRQRVMEASCVHGRVGAFYALRAREGNQILQMNLGSWPLLVMSDRGHVASGWPSENEAVTNANVAGTASFSPRRCDD